MSKLLLWANDNIPPAPRSTAYLYNAVHDTASILNPDANSPETSRSIEERAGGWKSVVRDADPRPKKQPRCRQYQKLAKTAGARLFLLS
jgi:hypothetical protein